MRREHERLFRLTLFSFNSMYSWRLNCDEEGSFSTLAPARTEEIRMSSRIQSANVCMIAKLRRFYIGSCKIQSTLALRESCCEGKIDPFCVVTQRHSVSKHFIAHIIASTAIVCFYSTIFMKTMHCCYAITSLFFM